LFCIPCFVCPLSEYHAISLFRVTELVLVVFAEVIGVKKCVGTEEER
jgi:hypothetical protein